MENCHFRDRLGPVEDGFESGSALGLAVASLLLLEPLEVAFGGVRSVRLARTVFARLGHVQ